VFAPSKRKVAPVLAKSICQAVPNIKKVGVFVNAPLTEVQDIAKDCRLDYVQICGAESPEYCQAVGYPVIKVAKVPPSGIVPDMSAYKVDYLLLDTYISGSYGGTGTTFCWQAARKVIKDGLGAPIIVAGGLTSENVTTAILETRSQGVDVSGGVETDGEKDVDKIAKFIAAARDASTMLWRR
jgi:phosphoribosylanthranilate isomerase